MTNFLTASSNNHDILNKNNNLLEQKLFSQKENTNMVKINLDSKNLSQDVNAKNTKNIILNLLNDIKDKKNLSVTKCPDFITLEMLKNDMKGNFNSKNSEIDLYNDKNILWKAYCSVMFCENPFGIIINKSEFDNSKNTKRQIYIQKK